MQEAVDFAEISSKNPGVGEVVDEINPGTRKGDEEVTDGQVCNVEEGGSMESNFADDNSHNNGVSEQRADDYEDGEADFENHFQCWWLAQVARVGDFSKVEVKLGGSVWQW